MSTPETQQAYAQGYHVGYQHGLQAAQQGQTGFQGQPGPGFPPTGYPINLVGQYPERSSRLLMFFWPVRILLLIPHMFVIYALGIAAWFVMIVAWFAVVFTGRYPQGLWNFMLGTFRWQSRIGAYALALTDQYPPFSLND